MILDNLTRAFKTQNWLAAATEFVIVIAGVVIGFQVNAWNEGRQDQARGRLYLERLATDFEENVRRTETDIVFRTDVRNLGLEALAYAAGRREPETSWRVVAAYFNASQAGSSYPVRSTFEEMLATGDLRLIDNLELRGQLNVYFTDGNVAQIIDSLPRYRERVRTLIPIELQNHIWEACYEAIGGAGGQRVIDCPAPEVSDVNIDAIAALLVSDETLTGELRYWVSTQRAALSIYDTRREDGSTLLEAIRAELDRS
jgi:hypothetical protein